MQRYRIVIEIDCEAIDRSQFNAIARNLIDNLPEKTDVVYLATELVPVNDYQEKLTDRR